MSKIDDKEKVSAQQAQPTSRKQSIVLHPHGINVEAGQDLQSLSNDQRKRALIEHEHRWKGRYGLQGLTSSITRG